MSLYETGVPTLLLCLEVRFQIDRSVPGPQGNLPQIAIVCVFLPGLHPRCRGVLFASSGV